MVKKKTRQELAFPVPVVPKLGQSVRKENPAVIEQIIRGAIQGSYLLKTPSEPHSHCSDYGKKQQPIVSQDQIQLVIHLIESLEPANAIEAALASQFVISYIRGLAESQVYRSEEKTLRLFEFGHQVLETLTKFRTKGAQLISVQYNHNQGMINNINIDKKDNQETTIEA